MSPKRNPQRKRTKFGAYLTNLRQSRTELSTAKAAKELGFKNRQQLDHYETGRVKPTDSILIQIARLYRVSPDEVLRTAHWPQLILLPIVSIIDPEQLSDDIIEEIEKGLERAERQKLTRYIEELLRGTTAGVSNIDTKSRNY
jgi:transcriptional regulator with XRE-family HTH domain